MSRRLTASGIVACVALAASAARAQYNCSGVSETANTTLSSQPVVTGLSEPLFVTSPPGDRQRLFVVERAGRIKIHQRGTLPSTVSTFLDITTKINSSGQEMGLLGLAFDPDYATTGFFWVNYTEVVASQIFTVVARYTVSPPTSNTANPLSESRVLRILQPEPNHKGGMLMFGFDGFLYVFTGDGGGGGDNHGTCGNAQNLQVLLGKILRLDVRNVDASSTAPDCGLAGATYRVPKRNPFGDGPAMGLCDEIWAYGVRNPWRPSFDALTGDLYVADVGQDCTEEVNWTPASSTGGENYGWRKMEGSHCFDPANRFNCNPTGTTCAGTPPCNDPSLKLPVVDYAQSPGCSVTGGYVYRGCKMPNYRGRYFYGDYCAGFVSSFVMAGGIPTSPDDVTSEVDPTNTLDFSFSSFGVDGEGELYAISLNGTVLKFVPPFPDLEVSGVGSAIPFQLSKTGDWTWEDLFQATDVPVSYYRVYRGAVLGPYACVFKATTASWPAGGDPAIPAPDQLFAYVITAVNAAGQETARGTAGTFDPSTCP